MCVENSNGSSLPERIALRYRGGCSAEDVTTAGGSGFISGGCGRATKSSSPATQHHGGDRHAKHGQHQIV